MIDRSGLAKQELFDFDHHVELPSSYDPYRNANILKDSNNTQNSQVKSTFKMFSQDKQRYSLTLGNNNGNEENNLCVLKKTLRRLESMPSPEKNLNFYNQRVKTMGITPLTSFTETVIIKKNKEVFVRTFGELKNMEQGMSQMKVIASRPSSSLRKSKKKYTCQNSQEESKVRTIIKNKLTQNTKINNFSENIVNSLWTKNGNGFSIGKTASESYGRKERKGTMKILNIIC